MPQAAIIGGGFAGMTMALFLKKHGMSSAIDEARDKNYTSGGNIALAPNTLRVPDHAGVYDCKEYNFQALRVHRTIIRDVLRAELERQDVPVVYSKRCVSVINDDATKDIVTVAFEGGERITANFVIGADGIHSRI
ncbi:hypothetical protein LTR66_012824 [Elasticomyces elasticus]|nr:hypothetical protein LTR66_012824 [Elasticomyces elasticus]